MEIKPAGPPVEAQVALKKKSLASDEQVTKKVIESATNPPPITGQKPPLAVA